MPANMQNAGIITRLHKQDRPTGLSAGGAFLRAEAWRAAYRTGRTSRRCTNLFPALVA